MQHRPQVPLFFFYAVSSSAHSYYPLDFMINTLRVSHVLPRVFADAPLVGRRSEVWEQDLVFRRGESYLIEAESGRGKTSLCAYIAALRTDFIGQILLDERPIGSFNGAELRRTTIGVMFQDLRLFPELTAFENVALKNQLTGHFAEADIRERLATLGLSDRIDTPCCRLSVGQQQRVAFVRMLCQPADFMLLDEPVSHLDDHNASIMADMLRNEQQRHGFGVLATSIGRHLPYCYTQTLQL